MRLIRRHLSTATHHKKSRRLIVDPGGSAVRSKTVRSCRFYSRPAAKPLRSRPPILRRKVTNDHAAGLARQSRVSAVSLRLKYSTSVFSNGKVFERLKHFLPLDPMFLDGKVFDAVKHFLPPDAVVIL